jgi:hypothetical protein
METAVGPLIQTAGLVTVVTQHGKKCTQLGGLPLEYLLGVLMRELAAEQLPDAY